METDKSRFINKKNKRIARLFLGIGTLTALIAGPNAIETAEKVFLSSNPEDYSWRIDFDTETCFSKESPTTENSWKAIVIKDAYCPTIINKQTNFSPVLKMPMPPIENVKQIN